MKKPFLKKDRKFFVLKAKVLEIGELIYIKRDNSPDMYKKMLVLETEDGQRVYPELRNKKLNLAEDFNIVEGDIVEIEYSFEGSEKNGKRYNNIYINSIKKCNGKKKA